MSINGKSSANQYQPDAAGRVRAGRHQHVEIQDRKDGSAFRAMLFASPVNDGQGAVTNPFLSYLDITRRWVAEEGLHTLTVDLEARPDCNKGTSMANFPSRELQPIRPDLIDRRSSRAGAASRPKPLNDPRSTGGR